MIHFQFQRLLHPAKMLLSHLHFWLIRSFTDPAVPCLLFVFISRTNNPKKNKADFIVREIHYANVSKGQFLKGCAFRNIGIIYFPNCEISLALFLFALYYLFYN